MATITFDTLAYAKKLKQGGFTEQQAETAAEVQAEAIQTAFDLKDVATKRDIEELRLEIKSLEVKMAETKAELVRWVVGAGFLQTALIAALLLKLIK